MSEPSSTVQSVSDIVGDWGRWQRNIFIFFVIGAMFSAWHALAISFYAPDIDYWCVEPSGYEQISSVAVESELRCFSGLNSSVSCTKWEYDNSFYTATIISEWNLVCDRSWLSSLTSSAYMAGQMLAVLLFGHFGDKLGRFPVIMVGVVIELTAGLLSAMSVSIEMFLLSRFLLAFGNSGRWTTGFVLILELSGKQYRSDIGIGIQFGWSFGYILIPAAAYLVPNFRYLQLICTIPEVFMLVAWWLIPESPRWLLTQGKWDEATAVIEKAVKSNNLNDPDIGAKVKSLISTLEKEETEKKYLNKSNLFDLLKHPRMRLMTITLYLTWFTNTFVYYGLSLNTGSLLEFNPFISFLISGAVEFPAYLVTLFLLRSFGRRIILSSALVVSGAGLLLTLLVKGSPTTQLILAMVGKFCITSSFAMVYVYTAEIFPTTLRNVGVGSSSMIGRIGSILAPFAKELAQYTGDNGPMLIFGLLAIGDAILILLFLPETFNKEMPDTLEEVFDGFSNDIKIRGNIEADETKPLLARIS